MNKGNTMAEYEFKEKDWKLFRAKIGGWQEAYMEKLLKEYREILSEDIPASKRFWKLEKKIREDQKNPGVLIDDMRRSTMLVDLYNLISWQVITLEDLSDFSEDLQKKIAWFTER